MALDFKHNAMLKVDDLVEHEDSIANGLDHVCKNILGHDVVAMVIKKYV